MGLPRLPSPPHLAADLKTLCLSTVASQWRPLAEQAVRQRQNAGRLPGAAGAAGAAGGDRPPGAPHPTPHPGCPLPDAEDAGRLLVRGAARPRTANAGSCRSSTTASSPDAANVLFVRGAGTGKTHLSIALGGWLAASTTYRVRGRDRSRAGHAARRSAAAGGPSCPQACPLRRRDRPRQVLFP